MPRRIQASNTTANLQPLATTASADIVTEQLKDATLTQFADASIAQFADVSALEDAPIDPAVYSPYYVTRAEWQGLLDRILLFNGRAPHKL
jgi:hypothetical protein